MLLREMPPPELDRGNRMRSRRLIKPVIVRSGQMIRDLCHVQTTPDSDDGCLILHA